MWKPGDLAILGKAVHMVPSCLPYLGTIVELVRVAEVRADWTDWSIKAADGFTMVASEPCLHPIPPPEIGDWDDCVWKPKEFVYNP